MDELDVPELAALERLMKEWDVRRADCTPMERVGFHRLKKQGYVQIRKGVYLRPNHITEEEFDAWFVWIEDLLGITPREGPL